MIRIEFVVDKFTLCTKCHKYSINEEAEFDECTNRNATQEAEVGTETGYHVVELKNGSFECLYAGLTLIAGVSTTVL